MAIIDYEDKIKELVDNPNHDTFIYDFLEVYDKIAKSTITKLRKGSNNLSKENGEVYLKNKLYFKEVTGDVLVAYSNLEDKVNEIASKPRYIVVTNYQQLLAKDTQTADTLDIEFKELPKYFDFFLAWNGIEKVDFEKENPADIKAAERFAKLFDEILKSNEEVDRHGLNLFLIRILFCMFAEDTGIFDTDIFTNFIKTITAEDGSDMNDRISELFAFLDRKIRSNDEPAYLAKFPYVNGQLFTEPHMNLNFSPKARKLIIDAGELIGWAKVNPDILGSMLQAVATEDKRSHLGMHYTSVPNIMKVIKPLFLDNLREEFEAAKGNEAKLNALLTRMGKIKFMDPACGSGNFLIITYKELRRLEMDILSELIEINPTTMYIPTVSLSQFYGIEIEDFAVDVTRLSLWIADHQMNKELSARFHDVLRPTLPLQQAGDIHCGNALRLDWEKILPHKRDEEIYLFGNPPYIGSRNQTDENKDDMSELFNKINGYRKLDYVCSWYLLGAKYIKDSKAEVAFVTTNSIFQGEQVPIFWPLIFSGGIDISFAYEPFNWTNNAKNNAGVIVTIAGLRVKESDKHKIFYFSNGLFESNIKSISPYLSIGEPTIVKKVTKRGDIPQLQKGNAAYDDGHFTFSESEYREFINKNPQSQTLFKKYISASDFINGDYKYCLWITEENIELARSIPDVVDRIEMVRIYRENSKRKVTRKAAKVPYKFGEIRWKNTSAILIPVVSGENRLYVPMSYIDKDIIPSYATFVINDAPIWLLGILESRIHMVWLRAMSGRLGMSYRYSAGLVYNTFPIPNLSTRRKNEIEKLVLDILSIREEEEGTLADLYGSPLAEKNPKPMNARLLEVHQRLDKVVDRAYKERDFKDDNERLSLLLRMYSGMVKK